MVKGNESLWQIIWSILCHVLRFFQLLAIFMPAIILFPFRRFGLKDFWLKVFVKSVERAGVVWIKCFQYMSHRGDIIGRDMADKFVHLR
jgi:predicted unusual protein kinase regulating ubiquinone biosynthesis (AarF/ABC1/UbiB family)